MVRPGTHSHPCLSIEVRSICAYTQRKDVQAGPGNMERNTRRYTDSPRIYRVNHPAKDKAVRVIKVTFDENVWYHLDQSAGPLATECSKESVVLMKMGRKIGYSMHRGTEEPSKLGDSRINRQTHMLSEEDPGGQDRPGMKLVNCHHPTSLCSYHRG